ncbi:Uncharacterized protein FWK35_00020659 [Aphis craccivora]|uniref:Transmembrane protein n=1 Tax=Aphis craccivora TaxID=307492 RepID=A0A6G0Y8E6_APHCR|nr:Uncharacterized protein FWK35_00020659 [Aphis craccivora]
MIIVIHTASNVQQSVCKTETLHIVLQASNIDTYNKRIQIQSFVTFIELTTCTLLDIIYSKHPILMSHRRVQWVHASTLSISMTRRIQIIVIYNKQGRSIHTTKKKTVKKIYKYIIVPTELFCVDQQLLKYLFTRCQDFKNEQELFICTIPKMWMTAVKVNSFKIIYTIVLNTFIIICNINYQEWQKVTLMKKSNIKMLSDVNIILLYLFEMQFNSERSEECIDFTMMCVFFFFFFVFVSVYCITSRNNAPISNYGGGFRCKSEYPWCIIEFSKKSRKTKKK